jgi:uncharacterized protein (TIGR02118 family)
MVKIVWLLKRAPHLSQEAFERWWLEYHVPVARTAPKLRRYVVNLPQRPDGLAGKPTAECEWDGVAEQWFDTEDDLNAAYSRPVSADIRADTLAHVARLERLIVREVSIATGTPNGHAG